ncbi:Adenylate cyclase type 2 [Geodia barretti]|uniref:adenylate cyclase n=1 Tax=Geodia barretti TaxID=519541 RepID=A0AA35TFB6_GEOBA|nr:Adenylate cyclase type 2 [Geodia barretti]
MRTQIIEKKKYRGKVEKIKTIGSTYMAATGLGENQPQTEEEKVKMLHQNVVLMAHFAFELIRTLNRINREIFNDLKMRIGLNHGPVVAGVIGSQKPLYDIWGDTVNVASRMDSTGHLTKIQVTEATANILSSHGFVLEKRGSVPVKGKGELTTFFVVSEQRKS